MDLCSATSLGSSSAGYPASHWGPSSVRKWQSRWVSISGSDCRKRLKAGWLQSSRQTLLTRVDLLTPCFKQYSQTPLHCLRYRCSIPAGILLAAPDGGVGFKQRLPPPPAKVRPVASTKE